MVLDEDEIVALVDFDTSKLQSVATATGLGPMSRGYVHKDVFDGKEAPSPQSDMYSFGVVLSELLGMPLLPTVIQAPE